MVTGFVEYLVPVMIPHKRVFGPLCPSKAGYVCTRPEGHTGRCAATGSSFEGLVPVYAVWWRGEDE